MSGLHSSCRHQGDRLSIIHVFKSRGVFELTHDTIPQTKSRKCLTALRTNFSIMHLYLQVKSVLVSGRSKQANIHMHGHNEIMLVWGSLEIAQIKLNAKHFF